ncbi:uncharacterized protein OCT59_029349 [Rhizophagus irregularis]|uniref:uncharacterized protein n=1 Tax=Rhizophagus irregularis TaxID=588596 RepID=UPI0033202C91|nr:hypothetical protein OCT59_029349 [Rhizophagus irregularis]
MRIRQNLIELLKDDEYYDITIEVGEDPNVKIFRAHTNILCYRSPYLRRTIATNKKNNDNILTHIRLPKISPEIFQIILTYIYGGILSLNEQNVSENLKLLATADQLQLQELIDYLQKYLIENKSVWIKQHFELTHRTSFQSNNLLELQQCCTDIMANSPEQVFSSLDFTSLPEKSLVSLIERNDLKMKEIEVWERVLKWGLAQNPTIVSDPDTWKDDDFKIMKNTLQHCTPLFHDLCDGKIGTVTFFKVKGTDEILGGYNPRNWITAGCYYNIRHSFIFSFKSKCNLKDAILSNVENAYYAIDNRYRNYGPSFGDLLIWAANESNNYEHILTKKNHFKKKIRDDGEFSIEDYEVFQIIKR